MTEAEKQLKAAMANLDRVLFRLEMNVEKFTWIKN